MNTEPIEQILKDAIGLDAASIGSSAVARAVRTRAKAIGCDPGEAYLERLRTSPQERQALVEEVVVPETWFFRDPEAFALLGRRAQSHGSTAPKDSALRVLSVPCATGEEPYSIAMTLRDCGLPSERCQVDAVDVSDVALARAQAASYGRNSFRGSELAYRERHFASVDGRWKLDAAVAGLVRFSRGNLLDPAFVAGRAPYPFVFCRNLLIYFDRATQDRAVRALAALVDRDGVLFVGPSETALFLDHGFEVVRAPLAFALTRATAMPKRTAPLAPDRPRRANVPPSRPLPRSLRDPARPSSPPPSPSRIPATKAAATLDDIARLAGGGHLAEAGRLCEEHLRTHGRSAQAYYLLGVVRDASGEHEAAADLYRRAVYLDPTHHDALMHLAYLLEASGDAAAAKVLSVRAKRLARRA